MKVGLLAVLMFGTTWLAACSRSPSLPPGVALHVKNGEIYLALDKDVAVSVYQNKKEDRRFVIVANRGDYLSIVQVEKGGYTPHSLDLFSATKANSTVMSGTSKEVRSIIVDEDGDGLPDLKLEGKTKYRAQISWIAQPRPQPSPAPQ